MAISKRRFASFPRESELPVRVSLTRNAGTLLFGLLPAKCLLVFPQSSYCDAIGERGRPARRDAAQRRNHHISRLGSVR